MIKSISLGSYYFEIALIFREACYLSTLLLNSEVWHPITKKHIEALEAADARFFELCFSTNSKTIRDAYYAETGKLKIRHLIVKRRLLMLHNILRRDQSDMIVKVYQAQCLKPAKFDWAQIVSKDKMNYNVSLSDSEISKMSKNAFRAYIERKVNEKSYLELIHSDKAKIQNIIQNLRPNKNWKLPITEYLKTNLLTTEEKKLLFSLRCIEYDFKSNYKTKYQEDMRCRICLEEDSEEDEYHTYFKCKILIDSLKIDSTIKLEYLYGNLEQQVRFIKHIMPVTMKRDTILQIR